MALPATEDFATANDPLSNSANWAQAGATAFNGKAVSGVLRWDDSVSAGFADQSAYWSADSFANDQFSQIELGIDDNTGTFRLGVIVRAGAGNEAILIRFRTDAASRDFEAYRWLSGGSRVALTGNPHTPSETVNVNDIIRAEVSGTTLTLKVDYGSGFVTENTWDIDTGDASAGPTSGSAGLYIVDDDDTPDNIAGDNWEGGNLTAGINTIIIVPTGPPLS